MPYQIQHDDDSPEPGWVYLAGLLLLAAIVIGRCWPFIRHIL